MMTDAAHLAKRGGAEKSRAGTAAGRRVGATGRERTGRMTFAGRVVCITGASSGLGWAMARELARQGARVGVLARREERLRQLCDEVRQAGGAVEYAVADAADRPAVHAALKSLAERLGPCDVLVANAGVGASNTAMDLNVPAADQVIRTNLLGPMYAFEAVLPDMLRRKSGHLVGISSVAAFKGFPTAAAYCASKAGLNAYLESIRISLRRKRIAVTTICPGFVKTEMTADTKWMPWVLEVDVAARKMVRAIARRRKVYSFPRRMRGLVALTRWLPDWAVAKAVPETSPIVPKRPAG
jgi:short-subunit dehydrogenase